MSPPLSPHGTAAAQRQPQQQAQGQGQGQGYKQLAVRAPSKHEAELMGQAKAKHKESIGQPKVGQGQAGERAGTLDLPRLMRMSMSTHVPATRVHGGGAGAMCRDAPVSTCELRCRAQDGVRPSVQVYGRARR